ncbi:NADH-quinone oxidoreductase subunit M [Gephyromycinifex aptenodytis]|uniref:NADH-quinone oxidoreductase subunit M n=1 Tax=Gephyromycinifex aptenodytis TaxID=2716227 RepID=UPI00144726A9|nr:NADH-quinone oxidoreductase subunit M [Gephyromycinifex aptenodytis]
MLSSFPWLTTIGLIPLVGALVVMLLPGRGASRLVALVTSLITLAVAVLATMQFQPGAAEQFQLVERVPWIPQWGVSYALGVDGMALAMILMAAILVPICLLAAWNDVPEGGRREKAYFAWMLVLETMMVGVFASIDVFLFYVFFEAMLLPVYFLIGSYGGAGRTRAAIKFLLFSLAGGLIMLVAVIAVFFVGPRGPEGYLIGNLTNLTMAPMTENLLFLGFFIAFAVKAPMWPVHTWLPEAATEARPATAVLLVGVLDKVGTYGMIRFCLQMFPNASQWATPVIIVLALISILYGAAAAIGSRDMMRLIAYTSVSHFGFIVLGIFALTSVSQAGSILYMVNHGFSTAALFLIAGMLVARGGSKYVGDYGGWQRVTPVLAGSFLVAGLSGLAMPGMGSFVSEFLVMMGTFQRYPVAAVISSVGIILAAVYVLVLYKRVFTGPQPGTMVLEVDGVVSHTDDLEEAHQLESAQGDSGAHAARRRRLDVLDLDGREKLVVAPLIALFLVLGCYPKPVLDVINPAVEKTLQYVGVADPAPAVGAANGSTK